MTKETILNALIYGQYQAYMYGQNWESYNELINKLENERNMF